jgi:hypothetical protein
VLFAAAILGAFAAVQLRLTRPSRLSAQETLLTRQNQALIQLTASAEKGKLLDFKDILVVVDQSLIQDLLRAVTPMDADVGSGFHVRIDSADTTFGDGVALVRMTGIATRDASTVGAEVTVLGAIEAVQVDPVSGVLRCSVAILGVEAQDAEALGRNDPIGRLTEALAHGGLSMLLGGLEIPVRVENQLSIPAVASKRLQIVAEELPLSVAAQQIKVFGGKLWVFIDLALKPHLPGIGAKS